MKANEVPEKIYLHIEDGKVLNRWNNEWAGLNDIEYTHTDVFIEKALKWYCLDCECNDNCKDTKCFFYREYERYLKGGTNALPPKFSDRILNEDGSISNNWRYRHFIAKIQDVFIEKATAWLEEHREAVETEDNGIMGWIPDYFIEDFKNYMKGE